MTHLTEDQVLDDLNKISKFKHKNERLSWKRKFDKLQKILEIDLKPIENAILELVEKKEVILDDVVVLRKQMSKECVHPFDFLIHKGDRIECKFCNCTLSLPLKSEVINNE